MYNLFWVKTAVVSIFQSSTNLFLIFLMVSSRSKFFGLFISSRYVLIMKSCFVIGEWILFSFFKSESISSDFLFMDLIGMLGISGIAFVGRLGHLKDHAACSVELQAVHFIGSSVEHLLVE